MPSRTYTFKQSTIDRMEKLNCEKEALRYVVSSRIRQLRIEAGLTREKVCEIIDCSLDRYNKYEYELSRDMPLAVLLRFADLYGVTTDWLLGRTSLKHSRTNQALNKLLAVSQAQ